MKMDSLSFLEPDASGAKVRVPVLSIVSVEDTGAYRLIVTDSESYRDSRSLPEIRKLLPDDFLLTDLHHLTNMNRILRPAEGAFIMDNGSSASVESFLEEHTRLQFYRWIARCCWESEGRI